METGCGRSGLKVQQTQLCAESEVCDATKEPPPTLKWDPALSLQLPEGTPTPGATPTSSSSPPTCVNRMVWDAGDAALGTRTAVMPRKGPRDEDPGRTLGSRGQRGGG